ncbi:MAG TPA: DUF2088 domain-containing protein [Anaerolineae bacterium]|nr:DUF2088 domain-containing protein [Anaerolineae bacterium]
MAFPKMFRVRQKFDCWAIERPEEVLREQLRAKGIMNRISPGKRVCITAGSRAIANLVTLMATLVDEFKKRGTHPFIVPAMGSHGGATADGQLAVLRRLGIREETVNAPIISSMKVVEVGRTAEGLPVYCDEEACHADFIVIVNRVKAHTAFKASIESGLMKMMAVGLGKREGAEVAHAHGLAEAIPQLARVLLEKTPIGLGVALVENQLGQTAKIAVLEPDEIEEAEKQLLKEAKHLMLRLPFDQIDVLIVEEIGKNISGTGMDTNVIGIGRRIGGKWKPEVGKIVVLDLTEESQGNALGIGLADLTTRRLVNKIDWRATYANVIATGYMGTGKIPVTLESDREAIRVALQGYAPDQVRLVRIRNTRDLQEIDVSEGLLEEVQSRDDLIIVEELGELGFDSQGNLLRL